MIRPSHLPVVLWHGTTVDRWASAISDGRMHISDFGMISFSHSPDVAAYFAINRWDMEDSDPLVLQVDAAGLCQAGFELLPYEYQGDYPGQYAWEQEFIALDDLPIPFFRPAKTQSLSIKNYDAAFGIYDRINPIWHARLRIPYSGG